MHATLRIPLRPGALLICFLAAAGEARAQGTLAFVAPTPAAGSLVTQGSVTVRLEAPCSLDPATLVVRLNGAALDSGALLPFGPCAGGRMTSREVSVALALPDTRMVAGPKRRVAGDPGQFTAAADPGDVIV